MSTAAVLGVDFGTSNSYFAKCPSDQISPVGVDFGGGRDGLASAVLYRNGKEILVGDEALQEWGDTGATKRANCRLQANFKPDIVTSDEARRHAVDFLAGVLKLCRQRHVDVDPKGREVIFGIPSEAGDKFAKTLAQVAKEAGYGAVRTVDEPIGALLSHMWRKDLTPAEAHKGVLVVDFGGGTCDFAFLRGLKVEHSWGDMDYGGRLFDDLFFQWFLDENPGLLDRLEQAGDEYYVHCVLCREAKEAFSRRMEKRNETVTLRLDGQGSLRGASWDTFAQRAKAYQPSAPFVRYRRATGRDAGGLMDAGKKTDLIGYFRKLMADGLEQHNIDRRHVSKVILAGGSSQWRFVGEALQEMLKLEPAAILRSDRPYAVIAEGLAILPALRRQFKKKQEDMRAEMPGLVEQELVPFAKKELEKLISVTAKSITAQLYDEEIVPVLQEFQEKGGTIAALKSQMASKGDAFAPNLQKLVDQGFAKVMSRLQSGWEELLAVWFEKHGLHYSAEESGSASVTSIEVGDTVKDLVDPYAGIVENITYMAAGAGASIAAMICGGAGVTLIASGPIGWMIGLVVDGIVAYLAVRYGLEQAKAMAEQWEIPAWVAGTVLREGTINEAREKFQANIESKLGENLPQALEELEKKLDERVGVEVDALSEIDQL
jgi:molecular chaperone DnaK (HSP70)